MNEFVHNNKKTAMLDITETNNPFRIRIITTARTNNNRNNTNNSTTKYKLMAPFPAARPPARPHVRRKLRKYVLRAAFTTRKQLVANPSRGPSEAAGRGGGERGGWD